jgi:hypothetical protein
VRIRRKVPHAVCQRTDIDSAFIPFLGEDKHSTEDVLLPLVHDSSVHLHADRYGPVGSKGSGATERLLRDDRLMVGGPDSAGESNAPVHASAWNEARSSFVPIVRRASKRAVAGTGWRAGTSGAFIHTDDHHWGQVAFRFEPAKNQTFALTAGALSPYLMRLINRLDPARNPPPDFIAASGQTEWFQPINYRADYDGDADCEDPRVADPCTDFVGQMAPSVTLGPRCADAWVEARVHHLVQSTQPLLTDQGLRDWILQERRRRSIYRPDLRYAIILTKHLGLDDELPALMKQDRELHEQAMLNERSQQHQQAWDRKRNYNSLWSHERFARWLNEIDTE